VAGDRGAERPQRLFVAVDVSEEAERAVEAAVGPLRDAFPGARWTPRQDRHVTLKFLGSTDPELVPWVRERVDAVARAGPRVRCALTGLGSFPSRAFTAHLTVARADPPLRLDPSVFATRLEAPAFTIDRLVLFRSHLGRPPRRYEALATFPLSGLG
jgi:2'-5' RNA ligase